MSLYKNSIFYLILCAYFFGVLCRMEWVYWASDFAQFMWNGELMISTNDGYAFAEGARDMLSGFHQPNDLSFYGSPLSFLASSVVRLSGFSLESVMVYLSIFVGSLLVVPLILIAKDLGIPKVGGIAAFVAVVANSYYNRTMAGYFDTDMLTIVLPCFVFWGMLRLILGLRGYFIAPISMALYFWWYPSSFTLNLAMLALFVFYILLAKRHEKKAYFYALAMLLSLCSFDDILKLSALILLFISYRLKPDFFGKKELIILGVLVVAIFAYFGGLNPIWFNMKFYLFRSAPDSTAFHFFNVNQTIMESGIVPFDIFCQRISSSVLVFCLSFIGYILAIFRHKGLVLTLPMTLLGFLALKGGLRFTIYAVPFMAFGFGYFVLFVANFIKTTPKSRKIFWYALGALSFVPALYLFALQSLSGKFASEFFILLALFALGFIIYFYKFRKDVLAQIAFVACAFALTPALIHIYTYKPLSVFAASEVAVLDKLKNIADREDYALAWWDYGYAIRFFSDVKTLIDGGKHLGNDNFAVSKALLSQQRTAANIARLEVEYTERNFTEHFGSNLSQMMKDYNASDVNEFLASLDNLEFQTPKPSRDVYFVLPDRMNNILSVVANFSRLDLKDGKSYADPVYINTERFAWRGDEIHFEGGLSLSGDGSKLTYGGKKHPVNTFISTKYENGKLEISASEYDPDAGLFVIYMRDYGRFIIMDSEIFVSSYIQLFVLENYDKELFEPVILDPAMKVYKIKK